MKMRKAIAVIFFFNLVLSVQLFAQQGTRGGGCWNWRVVTQYNGTYDPKTIEAISGEVIRVVMIDPTAGMLSDMGLIVKTDTEAVFVRLGPKQYIVRQDIKIEPEDKVEIIGSRIILEDKPAILAAEVRKDDEVLKLRDAEGHPLWVGMRQH